MGSRTPAIFLENKSACRIPSTQLNAFAKRVHTELRLPGDVAILVASDNELRRLNRQFRGKDSATDVLSFPADVPGHTGDIAISAEIAATNARALGLSLTSELKVLILHGLLHLAGYDHETDNGEMAARESELRRRFKLPQSLIARTHSNGSALRSAAKRGPAR